MSVNIEMPKLSDTMIEGVLLKWHKHVGDLVEIGDILADIETDKATMEMEAFDEGILTEIRVLAGEKTPIGTILAVLNGESNNILPLSVAAAEISMMEAVPGISEALPVSLMVSKQSLPSASPFVPEGRLKVSPLARKIASDLGVDLTRVIGSGPAGRIIKNDVEAAHVLIPVIPVISTEALAAAALSASIQIKKIAVDSPHVEPPLEVAAPIEMATEDKHIELSMMRQTIASRLLLSKTTIPHFYLHLDVDAAPLMALRRQINGQVEKTHGNTYSINDFILKAVVNGILAVPAVNASFINSHIVQFKHIGLSVAIAVTDGLVTPVIQKAESLSLLAISRAVKDFAMRAKLKKLTPDVFDHGTFTVSNLGAWGIESFDAIINPPQAAILAVGAVIEKPVVKQGQIVPGLRMNLGLSCDHRVIDGAIGAQFLMEVRKQIEKPALMLL